MTSLITLLYALISILSNPQISSSVAYKSQAIQIVNEIPSITSELVGQQSAYISPSSNVEEQNNYATPTQELGMGSESTVQPSCVLTGTIVNVADANSLIPAVNFTWQLTGMDTSTQGMLSVYNSQTKKWITPAYILESGNFAVSQGFEATFTNSTDSTTCFAYFGSPPLVGEVSTTTPTF